MIRLNDVPEILRDSESIPDAKPQVETKRAWFATQSQETGLQRLDALADVFIRVGDSTPGSFRPLLRPLIIGSTGTGKSTLAREFARQRQWSFTSIDCGSWIIQGAYSKPPTLKIIRDHVRSAPRTCLYLDEACKMFPGAHDTSSGWYLSVFSEFICFADGDERLIAHEWTREDIQKYKETCYVLCGGAFTSALKEAKRSLRRGGLGFIQSAPPAVTHSTKIAEALPDEIFSRFNPDHIILQAPTREDFGRGVEMIHADLGMERSLPMEQLLNEAEASNSGVRWLTGYLTNVLLEHPTSLTIPPEKETPKKLEVFDFFTPNAHHYCREITSASFDLRGTLARIHAELGAHRSKIVRSRNKAFARYLFDDQLGRGDHLSSVLIGAIRAANACTEISADDSAVVGPLMEWQEQAWLVMRRFPAELAQFGLLPSMVRSWDLTSRVAELRNKMSNLVAVGRIT